jgi:hypothetical protein
MRNDPSLGPADDFIGVQPPPPSGPRTPKPRQPRRVSARFMLSHPAHILSLGFGSGVWDEIVAFWLVLLMVTPATLTGQLWAFITFRFFDMVKPPPIGYFDRRLKGGFGIMFDDLVAAFFTLLVIALWRMSV